MEEHDFCWALMRIKAGKLLQRSGWSGEGLFVFLVPGSTFVVDRPPLLGIYPTGTRVTYHPHIDIKNVDGVIVPWLASQGDILADDWQEVVALHG